LNSINPVKQTISYIGTLSDAYPIIGFLDALKSLRDKNIDFNLKFVGTVSSKQKDLVISRTEKSSVDFIPYVDHSIAINYMLGATILLLIIPDHQSNKSIITGKIFEYLASGKPVLCLGPTDGDAAEIIRETGNGKSFNYNDVTGIETFLSDLKSNPGIYNNNSSAKFNRKNLTSQFVRIIREME
jgi:glycosyltransferase involved in cell wall biosynthesis